MSISLLLEMAASNAPDRVAIVDGDARLKTREFADRASRAAGVIAATGARSVIYVGTGGLMLPLLIFAAAHAGVPFTPLNYRLSEARLRKLLERLPDPLVVIDDEYDYTGLKSETRAMTSRAFVAAAHTADPFVAFPDPDQTAIILFTSGTTSRPKAVELSHNNLTSYVMGTVGFDSAHPGDAALICVPPYHIAGVSAVLSNVYAGRTMVYLTKFDPGNWLRLAVCENVTTATVVPTMLDGIVGELEAAPITLPSLRNLAYGGSKVALPLIRKALDLLPEVGFVNAYGLTETSSTVAMLTPEDHRLAHQATDKTVAKRLSSVGRPLLGIEVQIRAQDGSVQKPGATGELFVRGEQVSGHYAEIGSLLDTEGWLPTRDIATMDEDGYLFIAGRADDTIIRGGENIAPAELEDVLIEHPDVHQVAVVGAEDARWGRIIVAVVVPVAGVNPDPDALREYVRDNLRGSRTPDQVVFREDLPTSSTGKILRRTIIDELRSAVTSLAAQSH